MKRVVVVSFSQLVAVILLMPWWCSLEVLTLLRPSSACVAMAFLFVQRSSRLKTGAPTKRLLLSRTSPILLRPLAHTSSSSSESSSGTSTGEGTAAAAISGLFRKGGTEQDQLSSWMLNGNAINGVKMSDPQLQRKTKRVGDLSVLQSALTRLGMIAFIAGMCIALPLTLLPQKILLQLGLVDRIRSERNALSTGCFCARWMLRLIPFAKLEAIVKDTPNPNPEPAVWVCNHQSMLDVFFLLAADLKLRGKNKRPIKVVYWRGLEANPITKMLFKQCGFIPVAMAANKPGEDNEYDKGSFKALLKGCKQAFAEGFDVGLLPEGQLNPKPEDGLLPVFAGAHTLAKMARRPIHMMALHGTHYLWHPRDGMVAPQRRRVRVRNYHAGKPGRPFESADEFVTTFKRVVGHFGTTGTDLEPPEELEAWLSGDAWKKIKESSNEN